MKERLRNEIFLKLVHMKENRMIFGQNRHYLGCTYGNGIAHKQILEVLSEGAFSLFR